MLPKLTVPNGTLVKVTFESFFKPIFDHTEKKFRRDLKAKSLVIFGPNTSESHNALSWRSKYEQSIFMLLGFGVDLSYCGRDPNSPYYTYYYKLLLETGIHQIIFNVNSMDKFRPIDFLQVVKPD